MALQLLKENHNQTIVFNSSFPSYEELKELFMKDQAWGLLTCVDVSDCSPDIIQSAELIKQYVMELCDLIEMKRFGETVIVHFGEDEKVAGYSMTQLIETSLISGHFANLTNRAYIDVFSCKLYNPSVVAKFTQEFFKAGPVQAHCVIRQ
jgi:S-adenosylmethionine/arginine decarboxylase-like enzyme